MLRVTVCPGLAGTVPDFRGLSQTAVQYYNRHPGKAGKWVAVWPGVRAAQSTLQVGKQALLPACHTA